MTVPPPHHSRTRAKGRNPRTRHALLVLPYVWSVFAIVGINRIKESPGGVPLLLWWMIFGVIVTFGVLAVAWHGDERRHESQDHQAGAGCSSS